MFARRTFAIGVVLADHARRTLAALRRCLDHESFSFD
jgi:hypothetical protein